MRLEDTINNQIKDAMRAKDKVVLEALRSIKSAILLAKTEKAGIDALDEAAEHKLLNKLLKQRRESAEIFAAQNRPELAAEEDAQAKVIEAFLPKQLSEAEVAQFLRNKMEDWGIQGPADFGKFMGAASKALAGQADGKVIAAVAKALLNG
jgi:uncharacterized protein YqeY